MPSQTEPTKPASFVRFRDTRKAADQVGLYALWVKRLRRFLPAILGVFLIGLILWPIINSMRMTGTLAEIIPNLVVENLNFTGIDDANRPYSLTARRAFQAGGGKNLVDLEQPKGEIALDGGAWLEGQADYGRFDREGKRLWLGGAVELFHDQGSSFSTSELQLDMDKNVAWGDQPVVIKGPFGRITGDGFRALEGGDVFVVEGHAKAILNLRNLRDGQDSGKKDVDK